MRDHSEESCEGHILELLDRYFLNNLQPTEVDVLHDALEKAGVDLLRLEQLRREWETPWQGMHSKNEWVLRMQRHLDLDAVSETASASNSRTISRRYTTAGKAGPASLPRPFLQQLFSRTRRYSARQYAVVGAVAVLLGIGATAMSRYITTQGIFEHRPQGYSTYTTSNGERATITLADGTVITLNVASQLSVPLDYDRGNRAVRLTGEALFSVTHNTESAFTVTTQQSTTRVLGTSFIVRQYPTDTVATVAVRDGKVSVGSVVLTAGSETLVNADGTARTQAMTEERFGFAQGTLYISSRPLAEAIPELNRWYNVEIRLGDSRLAEQRMVGFFEVGSITDLLGILERGYGVRVVREGRILTLYPQG